MEDHDGRGGSSIVARTFDLDEDEPARHSDAARLRYARRTKFNQPWSIGGARASTRLPSTTSRYASSEGRPSNTIVPVLRYNRRQLRSVLHRTYPRVTLKKLCCSRCRIRSRSSKLDDVINANRGDQFRPRCRLDVSAQPSRYRLQLEGDVNVRLARGLSLSIEGSTSGSAISCSSRAGEYTQRGTLAASSAPGRV